MPIEVKQNGDVFTWNVRACNAGPLDATGVSILNTITPGVSVTAASPSIGTYNGVTNVWDMGAFPVGDCAILTLTMVVNDITLAPFTNTSVISGNEFDPVAIDNTDEDEVTDKCTRYAGCIGFTTGPNLLLSGTGSLSNPYLIEFNPPLSYDNDVAAGIGGIQMGKMYELSVTNTYGFPEGIMKVRRN